VLAAMRRVPRHRFVSPADRSRAYDDVSIPVGSGHSVRQPSLVALTIDKLDLKPHQKVLQVGTECAYCTAVLCDIPVRVYVVDLRGGSESLAKALDALGYSVEWLTGNACRGWRAHKPYDAILVMCAANGVPDALVDQLKVGGRMVIPIGEGPEQTLQCVTKLREGKLRIEVLKPPSPLRAPSMSCQRPLP
jgi:protein-L-isoaspartate(D-aspartate) O-methyltransferase